MPPLRQGLIMSAEIIVLVVSKHVSAEDITAESSPAMTRALTPGGRTSLITVGKAPSGEIPGAITLADIPIRVMENARGIMITAVMAAESLAVPSFRAQKSLE